MNIQIELIIFLILLIITFAWAVWFRFTRRIAKRRYKPENDKARLGEEQRREEIEGRKSTIASPIVSTSGSSQLEPGELLQTASSDKLGEDSLQLGKTSSSNGKVKRNPFRGK